MEIQLDFMLGVVVGIIGLAAALTIYTGIAESIKRNKEEKEWIQATYSSEITITDQVAHWRPVETQKSTDDGE